MGRESRVRGLGTLCALQTHMTSFQRRASSRHVGPSSLVLIPLAVACSSSLGTNLGVGASAEGSEKSVSTGASAGSATDAPAACPFVPGVSVDRFDHPNIVNVTTTAARRLPADFVGANSELTADAMDWENEDYQARTKALGLGWARYSAGTLSDAYDWSSGQFTGADQFDGGTWSPNCLLDPRRDCHAGWGTKHMYKAWDPINAHKSGGMKLPAWLKFASGASVRTVVDVNVFTGTPTSAKSLAKAFQAAGVEPVLWEMGNEVYDYQTWSPNEGYWVDQHIEHPFATSRSYVENVKPFALAIKEVFPDAHIGVDGSYGENDGWPAGIAEYTTATDSGGNCEEGEDSVTCDAAHFPVYFDTLIVHSYPCKFLPNDNDVEQKCLDSTLPIVASGLPGQLVNHPGCGSSNPEPTTGDGCVKWIDGFSPRVVYTEVNADLEGGDGSQVLVPEGTMRGTISNAVYLAEFVARSGSDALAYVDRVGVQQLYGNWFGLINGTREPVIREALTQGPLPGGTKTADYGLFYTAPGYALQIVAGALEPSTENLSTSVTWRPNFATVEECGGNGSVVVTSPDAGKAACRHDTDKIPAIFAATWRDDAAHPTYRTLLTNKGGDYSNVELQLDGVDIHSSSAPRVTFITAPHADAANTKVDDAGTTTNTAEVASHTCSLPSACDKGSACEKSGWYQVPPYSVTRIDWSE
jgi:hypothetical protein